MDYQEEAYNLAQMVESQRSYLYNESTQVRYGLERITDPLLQWVFDTYLWMQGQPRDAFCGEQIENLEAIEGLDIEQDEGITIEYDVEYEMGERTGNAMSEIESALGALTEAVATDPLMAASDNGDTAPVVDLFRTMAETLAPRR